MPEKPYELLWTMPSAEVIGVIKRAYTEKLTEDPDFDGVPDAVNNLDAVNSGVTQVYKDTDGSLKACIAFPFVFIHQQPDRAFVSYAAPQSYKGGHHVPEGFAVLPKTLVDFIERDTGGPYGRPPLFSRPALPTEIPSDFDPSVHFVNPSKVFTAEDEARVGANIGSEEGHEFDGPHGAAEHEPDGP